MGHIPQREKGITGDFFQPGFDLVAHAEEFSQQTSPPDHAAIPRYVEMAKRNGTWLTATLTLDERIVELLAHPETLAARADLRYLPPLQYKLVVEHNPYLERQDPKLVDYVRPSWPSTPNWCVRSTRREFRCSRARILPCRAWRPAFRCTTNSRHCRARAWAICASSSPRRGLPAQWLGTLDDRGTVETGKRADLVLLDANPLEDIANTRRISAVVFNGRYLPRAELDRRMAALAARNPTGPRISAAAP